MVHVVSKDDVASGLISELAGEGQLVDEGGFSLDPLEARAKLREHQLADRHAYVLLLVEAAHVAGDTPRARAIDFTRRSSTSTQRY